MIKISIYQAGDGSIRGFKVKGHAGYDDKGKDIVCAAVSVLAVNTVNSIEALTKDVFEVSEGDGMTEFLITGMPSPEAELLLRSLVLGLTEIEKEYSGYIKMVTKVK